MATSQWFVLRAILIVATVSACGGDGTGAPGDGADAGAPDASAPRDPPFAGCAGGSEQPPLDEDVICFSAPASEPDAPPLATVEHEFVTYEGTPAIHVRLTLNPTFVDNTFGATAIGWTRHTFRDLVGSDHAEIVALDATGNLVLDVKVDYLSEDASAPCGYASLGVSGGEGRMVVGDAAAILAWNTSLSRNLNERGYCAFTTDSPATDDSCTANADAPDWDFRVVYEIWIAVATFDPAGFGSAHMNFVHASPAKGGTNTVDVEPAECPPDICDYPDSCGGGPGGSCSADNPCGDGEFCYDGTCLPIVE